MAMFSHTKLPTSASEIQRIENLLGLVLPDDYKHHLLKYNGGQCDPNVFYFYNHNQGRREDSSIGWFLALYAGEYNNLEKNIQTFKIGEKRLPTHILPIAHDSMGNLVCISCDSGDYGHVYFWDHENEVNYSIASDNDYSNLYLIAHSFDEFIESLTDL